MVTSSSTVAVEENTVGGFSFYTLMLAQEDCNDVYSITIVDNGAAGGGTHFGVTQGAADPYAVLKVAIPLNFEARSQYQVVVLISDYSSVTPGTERCVVTTAMLCVILPVRLTSQHVVIATTTTTVG